MNEEINIGEIVDKLKPQFYKLTENLPGHAIGSVIAYLAAIWILAHRSPMGDVQATWAGRSEALEYVTQTIIDITEAEATARGEQPPGGFGQVQN